MNHPLHGLAEQVRIGLGLIQLGRPWGMIPKASTPRIEAVEDLITSAMALGVAFYDTAPSYGTSEAKFAQVLKGVSTAGMIIATKAGELWDEKSGTAYVDHSSSAMRLSLERSLKLLGRVDLVQIHKCSPDVLESRETIRFLDFAQVHDIPVGVSISEPAMVSAVIEQSRLRSAQFPLNAMDTRFCDVVADIQGAGLIPIVNRPFAMGRLARGATHDQRVEAFEFISKYVSKGVILTGTASVEHLEENVRAFETVFGSC